MPASRAAASAIPRRTALPVAPTIRSTSPASATPTRASTTFVARLLERTIIRRASHSSDASRPSRAHTSSSWSSRGSRT